MRGKQKYKLSSFSSRNALHFYLPLILFLSLPPFLCPPFFLSQRPLVVINTVVCISRMHLALTLMLKKVISGCMWLLVPADAHRRYYKWEPGSIGWQQFLLALLSSFNTLTRSNGLVMPCSKWLNLSLMGPQMQNPLFPQLYNVHSALRLVQDMFKA